MSAIRTADLLSTAAGKRLRQCVTAQSMFGAPNGQVVQKQSVMCVPQKGMPPLAIVFAPKWYEDNSVKGLRPDRIGGNWFRRQASQWGRWLQPL